MIYIYFEVKCHITLTHNPKIWCSYIKIVFKILGKITGPRNIGYSNLYLFSSQTSIIRQYNGHTSNSLQDMRQNHWTMKYRSQWPAFIFRSNAGSYRLIIRKHDVHISNSVQDIRQNHWTVKYRSCWPSLHDPQINVERLSNVWPTICPSCFHNRIEKHF